MSTKPVTIRTGAEAAAEPAEQAVARSDDGCGCGGCGCGGSGRA